MKNLFEGDLSNARDTQPHRRGLHKNLWADIGKLISGNSFAVIYRSATKVRSNTRTCKEHLFAEETIVTYDR